ncbi:potassium-transporting ATPase subunit KdpC [Plasticicumulans acidivorans]|uniref:Potassium-transporting ATPase KdpC subunit n=1 Tax=Plasticicumulans acidivorans TaxID=886464 RepID=A0A317MT25_9GAMM|nr:potassium-transporting ATPase subunit KdpC [Plasticicumulans acidivorans]PWV59872.1 K+-transporting ATPase ATPase C chain [Plasticicumulans acidivorans]
MRFYLATLRPALLALLLLSAITGLAYPLAVTGLAQWLFPWQANGSRLYTADGRLFGSALIGQSFTRPQQFWGRPSATQPAAYNAAASAGANLGPLHPQLSELVQARIAALRAADPDNPAPIPLDLLTSSASGLDPHISPAAAQWQAVRVARARGLPLAQVQALIAACREPRQFGVLGEARVNVVRLNQALDRLQP